MVQEELAFTPAWRLHKLLLERQVSSTELTRMFLGRIERLNPRLNAYLTVTADLALEQARAADEALARGQQLGPLHGIPVSIKDLNPTRGIRTTRGSLAYQHWVPDEDDCVAERVRASGAVLLGKTNTPEFGFYGISENRLGPPCRNPWDPERTAGGSSSGAAVALAAGLCALATGSDGGGSIRIPGGFCGVYGIKPTQGRVPAPYTGPGGWRPFSQNGPMARSVRDACLLFQVLAGPDPRDPLALAEPPPDFVAACRPDVEGLRLGWSPDLGFAAVDPEVLRLTEQAARVFIELGATVEPAELRLDGEALFDTFATIWWSDYVANYGSLLPEHRDELEPLLVRHLEEAMTWPAVKLSRALRELEWHRHRMAQLFTRYDLLLTPTLATPAFPIGQLPEVIGGRRVRDPMWGFTPFTWPINMSGQTAATVPCGLAAGGLPVGLHVVGPKGAEATVIRASAALEAARPWERHRPPVS